MKTPKEMYDEHLGRLKKALNFEEIDRPPISMSPTEPLARYMGVKMADFITDTERANVLCLLGLVLLGKGEIDSGGASNWPPFREVNMQMKLPGRDLGEDDLWQVVESEVMLESDYDVVLEKGWAYYEAEHSKRIGDGKAAERQKEIAPTLMKLSGYARSVGLAGIGAGVMTSPPIDTLMSWRSMPVFMRDLHRIPEKVIAVMDVMMEEKMAAWRKQLQAFPTKPMSIMSGGGRTTFVSPKIFERFDLPYRMQIINMLIEEGVMVMLHYDCNWDERIEPYVKNYPKKKCILQLDGTTNIFRAREILGDDMAIQGDVPDWMLALETPDVVYNYVRRLVTEVGPKGFILSTGCMAPPNAKMDNLEAMVLAGIGK